MDFEQYIGLGLVFIAITEVISRLRARDFWVVATIVSCAIVGAICGFFKLFGAPGVEVGILVAFGSSGALKAASVIGQRTTPAPSTLTEVKK